MKNGILQIRLAHLAQFSALLPAEVRHKFDALLHVIDAEIDRHIAQAIEQGAEQERLAIIADAMEEDPSP